MTAASLFFFFDQLLAQLLYFLVLLKLHFTHDPLAAWSRQVTVVNVRVCRKFYLVVESRLESVVSNRQVSVWNLGGVVRRLGK